MTRRALSILIAILVAAPATSQGFPPARVATTPVTTGRLVPTSQYKGTVYYKEIAEVANEAEGKVVEVLFEEGQHFKAGDPLVRLDAEVLKADLAAARATHKRLIALLEQERVRLKRVEEMLNSDIATTQDYDDVTFEVEARKQAVEEGAAQILRLDTILKKKTVVAPFDGVIVRRSVELGEWRSSGDTICTYARDEVFDIIVFFPEQYLRWVHKDDRVHLQVAGEPLEGFVPEGTTRGDVTTRTFPIRIRVTGVPWLLEGMSAEVQMPIGEETEALMVPRDALLPQGSDIIVYTVGEGNTAKPVTVEVVGHHGLEAGVRSDELAAGDPVIVKGHERLRPGAELNVEN